MATREEALAELYARGALSGQQKAAVEELARRGIVKLPESVDQQIQGLQQDNIPLGQQVMHDLSQTGKGVAQAAVNVANIPAELADIVKGSAAEIAGWFGVGDSTYTPTKRIELPENLKPTDEYAKMTAEILPYLVPMMGQEKAMAAIASAAKGGRLEKLASAASQFASESMTGTLASQSGVGTDGEEMAKELAINTVVGVAANAAMPSIGRIGRAIYRRVKGEPPAGALFDSAGNPTPEMADALDRAGVSMSDLQQEVIRDMMNLPAGSSPEQAARMAAFKQEGIPFTKGDITQDLPQQAMEARLAESASDPLAQPMRTARVEQSEKFRESLDSLLTNAGVPERTGESIKDALSGKKELMRKEKTALYKEATQHARNVGGVPVINDNIKAAIPTADFEDLAITAPEAISSLDGLLVKYGLKEPAEGYKGAITPLSIENAERFRKSLGVIERADQTGAIKAATNPIKNALDDELELMVSSAGESIPSELLSSLKGGREMVRKMKTEFSPQSMAGRLIDVKRDGVTPVIEASTVSRRLLGKAGTVEDVKRVMSLLSQSGDKGAQAIGDLQASVIMDLMEAGFGATSRKIDGTSVLSPAAFQKGIDKIGDAKLNLIFSNNKEALSKIKNLGKIAGSIQAQAGAIPKGSASVILDSLQKLGILGVSSKVPGIGLFVDVLDTAAKNKGTKEAVKSALDAKPDVKRVAIEIDRKYPVLAQALGIAAIYKGGDDQGE